MIRKFRQSEIAQVMTLMESRLPGYLLSVVIRTVDGAIFLNVIMAFILKDVIDGALKGDPLSMTHALVLAGSVFLVGAPVSNISDYLIERTIKKAMTDIRMKVFRRVVHLTMDHFEQHHSGDLISRMTNDLETIEQIYAEHVRSLIYVVLFGVIALIAIFILDWRFGLLVSVIGLATSLVNLIFAQPLRRLSNQIQARWGRLTERLTDLLQGFVETRMFQIEAVIHQKYRQQNEAMSQAAIQRGRVEATYRLLEFFFGSFRVIGLLALGLLMRLQGDPIEVGTIAAIIHLQGNANTLFFGLGHVITGLQSSLAGAGRVLQLLTTPIEPVHRFLPKSPQGTVTSDKAMVALKDVTFAYGEDAVIKPAVLRDLNLSVVQGEMVALVGPSGGGKSTLVKLLLGLYPLKQGDIVIAGKAVEQYTLAELRAYMAYVPQDAHLFAGTIRENIRYGKPDATETEIIVAAKAANAHDFILQSPHGYETLVGERGTKLSGGQRQRIAIARALLKDAPILLLDEATSALDSASEQLVQDALNKLIEGRTTIVIAHRLSTIEHANVIYVMDKGRVVEQGQHYDLIAKGGLYKRLYESQFRRGEIETVCGK